MEKNDFAYKKEGGPKSKKGARQFLFQVYAYLSAKFQPKRLIPGRDIAVTDGRTDARTDRSEFKGPFSAIARDQLTTSDPSDGSF